MIVFFLALNASIGIMLIMKTSARPPFKLAPEWRETRTTHVTRHRSALVPDRDWVVA